MSRRQVIIWPEGYAEAIDIDVRTLKAINWCVQMPWQSHCMST